MVALSYAARKQLAIDTGECLYPGCREEHADDSLFCSAHRDSERARQKAFRRQRRQEWEAKRLCTRCGRKRKPGHGWGCPKCIIELGATQYRFVTTHVHKSKRIASRTEVDPDGRTRYRGQERRGRQSAQQTDESDLLEAKKAIDKAIAGLALARSPEVQQLPRIQREAAKREALAQADHGSRFIEGVLERNRY